MPSRTSKRQVQPGKAGVALFEALDDPQGVQVVIESLAEARHLPVERLLAGMGERGVPDVVGQRQRFGEILVQAAGRSPAVRAICATSMVWVRRLRKWSESPGVKTCVLASSRRNARECTTRSRSRWNALR